jgi:hypothetical protein
MNSTLQEKASPACTVLLGSLKDSPGVRQPTHASTKPTLKIQQKMANQEIFIT